MRSNPRVARFTVDFASWWTLAARVLYADLIAVLLAMMLPWSTSAVAILLGFWLLALIPLIPVLDTRAFVRLLSNPICLIPLLIVALALIGTLWADSPMNDRIRGLSPVAKLLALPFLLYHFERSRRGSWVFIAFFASCVLLMCLSWIVFFFPEFKVTVTTNAGVPIKNYIDQSQEFALCIVAPVPVIISLWRRYRYVAATAYATLVSGFLANMAFVVSARAALIYLPIMCLVFARKYLGWRSSILLFAGISLIATTVWFTSPYWRNRISDISTEYRSYEKNILTSTGQRLEYWKKSLNFFAVSPVFGNGTGSIRQLFERDAVGKSGLAADVTRNPHNQTLSVAVQWGMLGVTALYAMWLAHLLLFLRCEGFTSWLGLLIVVQNVVSSLFNSHLFDFHEGWMYVFGVGIAGGMSLKKGRPQNLAADCSYVSGKSNETTAFSLWARVAEPPNRIK